MSTWIEEALARSAERERPKNARERSREETRRRLMAAWLELVAQNTPESVSIRDIAAKAEVSVGAFYCHFKDKDALNGEVAVDCYAKLVRELDTIPPDPNADIEARYASTLNVFFDFADRHPRESLFLFRLSPSETDDGREFLSLWEEFWDNRVEHFAEVHVGDLPVDAALDKAVMARAYWGMAEKVLAWWLRNRETVSREAVVQTLSRFVGKGVT